MAAVEGGLEGSRGGVISATDTDTATATDLIDVTDSVGPATVLAGGGEAWA